MKLELGQNQKKIYSGMANNEYQEAKPFKFLGV